MLPSRSVRQAYDYVLINDDLDRTFGDLKAILAAERLKRERQVEMDAFVDGLLAANSLHFQAPDRQVPVVRSLAAQLRPGGRFVVVEYDADRGNPWVPHPFGYRSWERMALAAGLAGTRQIGRRRAGAPDRRRASACPSRPSQNASRRSIRGRYPGNPGPPTASTPAPTGPEVPMD